MSRFDILRSLLSALDKTQHKRDYTSNEIADVTERLATKLKDMQIMSPATTPFEYDQNLQRALASLICEEVASMEEAKNNLYAQAHQAIVGELAAQQRAGVVVDMASVLQANGGMKNQKEPDAGRQKVKDRQVKDQQEPGGEDE
jgi:hypothetical protein